MRPTDPTLARLLSSWTLDPGLLTVLVAVAALYILGARRSRRLWPAWRLCSFLAGLLVLAGALLSGVDRYSEVLLSVHMVQHMLLLLVAPGLLLLGAPMRLALGAASPAGRRFLGRVLRNRAVRLATRPAFGFALLAIVTLSVHLTGLYELALRDPTVHAFEHAAYFWSGMLFLAPLIAADPLPHPPRAIARFAWLMGAMVTMAIPGVMLTFATTVRYPSYLAPADALGRSALADQHLAGAIMWIGGGVVLFALAIALAMRAMIAEEAGQRRREIHAAHAGAPVALAAEDVGGGGGGVVGT
jgi:cytochrome c oxidase assembly factor CtaG